VKNVKLGKEGERVAERYLRHKGYKILARNYRCPQGEIDLVVGDSGTLVFVEIKGRTTRLFGAPLEAVTAWKKKRLALVANHFLTSCKLHHLPSRFDVVGVRWPDGGRPELVHVKDAFRLPIRY